MYTFEVGKKFLDKSSYPETPEYNFYDGGHEFKLGLSRPSSLEINAFRRGGVEFGFLYLEQIIFFLYRFYNPNEKNGKPVLSGEAPFSIHLVPKDRKNEAQPVTTGHLINFYLINSDNGILEAMRAISIDAYMHNDFLKKLKDQTEKPFNSSIHGNIIKKIFSKYDTDDMFAICDLTYKI